MRSRKLIPIYLLLGVLAAHYAEAAPPTHGPNEVQLRVVSYSEIDLTWSAVSYTVPSVTGYKIEREFPIGSGFTTIVANTNSTATSYADTNLSPNITYNYRISAINSDGTGPTSTFPASATTLSAPVPLPPDRPTGLTATPVSGSEIDLSWTAPISSKVTGYKIERDFTVIVTNTSSTATTYADKNLSGGVAYDYRVFAINAYGISDPSAHATAATFVQPGAPQMVGGVAGDGRATISWLPPLFTGGGVTGYVIIGTPDSSSSVANVTSTIITGLTNDRSYFFAVSAVNPAGRGPSVTTNTVTPQAAPQAQSSTVSITPPAPPPATPIPPPSPTPALSSGYRFTYTLQRGSRGAAVTELQKRLAKAGFFKAGVSDYFGAVTEVALKAYQRAHLINPIGVLGPLTRAYLNANL